MKPITELRAKSLNWAITNIENIEALKDYELSTQINQKFAELIIESCISILANRRTGRYDREDLEVLRCINDIKEYFYESLS